MRRLLTIFAVLTASISAAQLTDQELQEIDSLKSVIATSDNDSIKIEALKEWDLIVWVVDPEADLLVNEQIIELTLANLKDPNSGISEKFLRYNLGYGYNSLGIIYRERGDYSRAVEYYTNSLKQNELISDSSGMSVALGNIGLVHDEMGNYDKAVEYHRKCLLLEQAMNDVKGMAGTYNNIGVIFINLDQPDSALYYYRLALQLKLSVGDHFGSSSSYNNIGNAHYELGDLDSAMMYYQLSVEIKEQEGDKSGLANTLNNMAKVYANNGDHGKALEILAEALELADQVGSVWMMRDTYGLMHKSFDALGRSDEALDAYMDYILLRDSLMRQENRDEVIRQEYKYDYEMQRLGDSLSFALENERIELEHDRELQKEANARYLLFGGLAIAVVLGISFFVNYRRKKRDHELIGEQKVEVEKQHKDITDSISYAQRIQEAMLPLDSRITDGYSDSFILYRPRDLVSGDFYWYYDYGPVRVLSVSDCTGHGVPGAFMSMLGIELLNQVIGDPNVHDPAHALQLIDERITNRLNKGDREKRRDGMDMVVLVYHPDEMWVQFAGANNPVVMIRDSEMRKLEAVKQGVGGAKQDPMSFKFEKFDVQPGDCFYLFSDGYQDQFGGPKGKKFMRKKFYQMLLDNHQQPMEVQKQELERAFLEWKGDLEQVDDVCVIGVRI